MVRCLKGAVQEFLALMTAMMSIIGMYTYPMDVNLNSGLNHYHPPQTKTTTATLITKKEREKERRRTLSQYCYHLINYFVNLRALLRLLLTSQRGSAETLFGFYTHPVLVCVWCDIINY